MSGDLARAMSGDLARAMSGDLTRRVEAAFPRYVVHHHHFTRVGAHGFTIYRPLNRRERDLAPAGTVGVATTFHALPEGLELAIRGARAALAELLRNDRHGAMIESP